MEAEAFSPRLFLDNSCDCNGIAPQHCHTMKLHRPRTHLIHLLGILVILAAPAIIGYYNPDIDSQQSLCPSKFFFDFDCVGCGLTKSLIHAYRGELLVSLRFHPWGVVLIAGCLLMVPVILFDLFRGTYHSDRIYNNVKLWQGVAALVFLTWGVRLFWHYCVA